MINDTNLIRQIKDFEDTEKYTREQFINFINSIAVLQDFFKSSVNQFKEYQQQHPDLIKKFVNDYYIPNDWIRRFPQYPISERKIIDELINCQLHIFYALSIADKNNWYTLSQKSDLTDFWLCDMYIKDDKDLRPKLIDYIIKFASEKQKEINLIEKKVKCPLKPEEIQVLKLRKILSPNRYEDIAEHLETKSSKSGISQMFIRIKNKLGANSPDEAVAKYEKLYEEL